jgi:hypothetical protein
MGRVGFPIDIVFADGGSRVARVVHDVQPGARDRWSHPVVSAVVEVPGGFCQRAGVKLGDEVRLGGRRVGAAQTYNLLRTLTEASPQDEDGEREAAELDEGYYTKEPERARPPAPYMGEPEERFEHHRLVDEWGTANDGMMPHWEQGIGYMRPRSDDPVYPLRMSAQRYSVDAAELGTDLLDAAERVGVPWEDVTLSEREQRAEIRPQEIGLWLNEVAPELGLSEPEIETAFAIATSKPGLTTIGKAFLAAGRAVAMNVVPVGDKFALVLSRGRK